MIIYSICRKILYIRVPPYAIKLNNVLIAVQMRTFVRHKKRLIKQTNDKDIIMFGSEYFSHFTMLVDYLLGVWKVLNFWCFEQTERAFQKQPTVFLNKKKAVSGKATKTPRHVKSIGLGFKTPREVSKQNNSCMCSFDIYLLDIVLILAIYKRRSQFENPEKIGRIWGERKMIKG